MNTVAIAEMILGDQMNGNAVTSSARDEKTVEYFNDVANYFFNEVGVNDIQWNHLKTRMIYRMKDWEEYVPSPMRSFTAPPLPDRELLAQLKDVKCSRIPIGCVKCEKVDGKTRVFSVATDREIVPIIIEYFDQDLFMPSLLMPSNEDLFEIINEIKHPPEGAAPRLGWIVGRFMDPIKTVARAI